MFLHFGHFHPYLVRLCRFFDLSSPNESVPVANRRSAADNFILFWYVPIWRSFFFKIGLKTDLTRFFEWVTNNKDCFIYQHHILHVRLKQIGGSHHLSLEINLSAAWYRAEDQAAGGHGDDEHFYSSHLNFVIIYIQIFDNKLYLSRYITVVHLTLSPLPRRFFWFYSF